MSFHQDSFHQKNSFTAKHLDKYILDKPIQRHHRVTDRYIKSLTDFYEEAFDWKTVKIIRKSGITSYHYYDRDGYSVFTLQVEHPKARTFDVTVYDHQNVTQSERDNYWK